MKLFGKYRVLILPRYCQMCGQELQLNEITHCFTCSAFLNYKYGGKYFE